MTAAASARAHRTARHFYEDLEIGAVTTLGTTTVSAADIIAFATAFDPQPLHLDAEAAKHTMVGQLCASGFHSCAILMRLLCDGYLLDAASLGSPGMQEVRWLKPVLPDVPLTARFVCLSKRPLASKPGVGLARIKFEMIDTNGETLMTWDTGQFLRLREPNAATTQGA
jgi:acyl dehydratase